MKIELEMSKEDVADILDKKLEQATRDVHEKSKGLATLTYKRINASTFEIEFGLPLQNRVFDMMILRQLKKTIKAADPGAKIRKIKR
jgi:hypothetical protein